MRDFLFGVFSCLSLVCLLFRQEFVWRTLTFNTATMPSFQIFLFGLLRQFLCVALEPVLEPALQTKLALNPQRYAYLCLPRSGIKGEHHQHLVKFFFLNKHDYHPSLYVNKMFLLSVNISLLIILFIFFPYEF